MIHSSLQKNREYRVNNVNGFIRMNAMDLYLNYEKDKVVLDKKAELFQKFQNIK